MDAKPWQIGVIAVGLLGGLGLVGWQLFGGSKVVTVDSMTLVDVNDGSTYIADLGGRKAVTVPARNPDTGEYTLVPVIKEGDSWVVPEYYRAVLKQFEKTDFISDPSTGVMKPTATSPKQYKRPG